MKRLFPILLVFLALSVPAAAETVTVSTVGFTWSPGTVTIQEGDTIDFQIGLGHNVVQTDGPGSCTNEPGGFLSGSSATDTSQRSFQLTLNAEGTYYFKCNPHCPSGMRGVIIVEKVVGVENDSWSKVKALYDAD